MPAKKSKPKSIVIIGTRGFRGRSILKQLETSSKYKNIIAIDYRKPRMTLKKTKFYKLDLTEALADATLADILKTENCDTLIHTAIPVTPPHNESQSHEVIAIGSYYIFNACHAAKVRKVVMASTTDTYGAYPNNPNFLTEDMATRGQRQSRYLKDIVDAENQAHKFQKKNPKSILTIIRPCTILGPTIQSYKTKYFSRPVIVTMLGFDPLIQFIHEDDVTGALMKAIDENHPGVFNLAGDGVIPLSKVIEISGKLNLKLTQIGFKSMVQALWLADISPAPASHVDFLRYLCIVDNEKIKKTLGYKPKYSTKDALFSFLGADRLRQLNIAEA
jgi:UDP-glucose 4-epimerase